jgi:serine/threonine-protein kinase
MIETFTTPGTVLLGKYRIVKELGKGAMGVVVAAIHLGFDRQVAIKFMLGGTAKDPERDARFLQEARIAARLTSQHVGKVLDVGMLDDGSTRYLVMEYLDGQDLDAVVKSRGRLPFIDAVSYVLQVCEAVAEAHKAGIVHRDLKPANLFLVKAADGSPCVKVLDFGVSKVSDGGVGLTQDRGVLGSPLYMSPEQMNASREVDARSDVWALGIVLYQLVADKTPFHGDSIQQVCARVFQGEPTPLSVFRTDAPAGFEAVLLRCFEKDRDRRWQDVAELAAALVPFGPARAVVHAERAAAILGYDYRAAHATDVLPAGLLVASAPREAAPSRAGAVVAGGSSVATLATSSGGSGAGATRGRGVVIGLGVAVLALFVSLGVALSRGGPKTAPEVAVVATATAAPTGAASVVPTATASSGPGTGASAAPSATVDAGVAKVPHGPAPKKKDPMQRE